MPSVIALPMKSVFSRLLTLALVSFFVAGCGGGYKPTGMTATIVDFRPTEARMLESSGVLTLRFTNETISPLGFSGSSHKLYLNGSYVGKAVNNQPFGVPPLSSITHDVTVNFENLALIRQLAEMGQSQTAAYRLDSVLFQTVYEDKYELKTQSQGSLDLRKLSAAAQ